MAATITYQYDYQKPQNTWTIDQFIACQNNTTMSYHNLSFVDEHDGIAYDTYNVLGDYIDEIREEYCIRIKLSDLEFDKYKYRPKLLCYDIYGNTELYFILLAINDMCSVKEFNKQIIYMPTKDDMRTLTKYLFNANRNTLITYNNATNNTTTYY